MLITYLSALLGGFILNAMPCVLPVLSLKAFQLVDSAKHDQGRRRLHGLAYTAGTVGFFLAAAIGVVILKSTGARLGWGLQFQHPPFVATLTAIIFAFALNALGVFELSISSQSKGGDEDALSTSLVNGFFAAVMATPCTAPFLSTAAGVALAAETSTLDTLVIFAMIGLGLALPYLAFTFVPALTKFLPRPGAWMSTFKTLMGFMLLATAVWFFGVLQKQITADAANAFLFFLVGLALVLWFIQNYAGLSVSTTRRLVGRAVSIGLLVVLGVLILRFDKAVQESAKVSEKLLTDDGRIAWVPWDTARLALEQQKKRPVFIDFTAEWCASCKANEKAFLETDAVRSALSKNNILPMKADLTNENEEIYAQLEKWGRTGIPAYVISYPDKTIELLPIVITAELVVDALDKARKQWPAQ